MNTPPHPGPPRFSTRRDRSPTRLFVWSDNRLAPFPAFLASDRVSERTARLYLAHVQRLAGWLAQHYQASGAWQARSCTGADRAWWPPAPAPGARLRRFLTGMMRSPRVIREACAFGGSLDHHMSSARLEEIAREFLLEMQECVRSVDYARAHALFAGDVVAFGTFAAVVSGRERLECEQWRNVWPTIRDFTFRLQELHCLGTEQALCVVVPWDSVGRGADAQPFNRPGRATLLLAPRGGRWVAAHSHFSLAPARPRA